MRDTMPLGRDVENADEVMASLRHRSTPSVSEAEIRRAWRRYLRETREAEPDGYDLAEEQAWARLSGNLAALGAPLAAGYDEGERFTTRSSWPSATRSA